MRRETSPNHNTKRPSISIVETIGVMVVALAAANVASDAIIKHTEHVVHAQLSSPSTISCHWRDVEGNKSSADGKVELEIKKPKDTIWASTSFTPETIIYRQDPNNHLSQIGVAIPIHTLGSPDIEQREASFTTSGMDSVGDGIVAVTTVEAEGPLSVLSPDVVTSCGVLYSPGDGVYSSEEILQPQADATGEFYTPSNIPYVTTNLSSLYNQVE